MWTLVSDVGDGLLLKRNPGDKPVLLKTQAMDLLLVKQEPALLEKESLKVGKSKVSFPPSDVLLKDFPGTASVDVQVSVQLLFSQEQTGFDNRIKPLADRKCACPV